jgi:predicted phage terminase large subunit-like protein
VLLALLRDGRTVVEHVAWGQWGPERLYQEIERHLAEDHTADPRTVTSVPIDPGAAGLIAFADLQREFGAYPLEGRAPSGDKITRGRPWSARARAGRFVVVDDGTWDVDGYETELEGMPDSPHDDRWDATSDAYAQNAREGSRGDPPAPPKPPPSPPSFGGRGRGFGA